MRRPILFLHVGFPKTGTKTIQFFLAKNRKWLKGQGLLHPRAGMPPTVGSGNHELAWLCMQSGWKGFEPTSGEASAFSVLREEVAEGPTERILLSSESFSSPRLCKATLMHELRMFDVRVIAVVRDQVSWWQSFYNQQVLRSSERRPIAQVSLEEQADFYQRLSEWVPYVGKRNILWIEYNDPTSSSALLVSRFFAAIGVDVEERLEERLLNSNRSACAEVVAFSRWLNGYLSPLLIKKKAQWLSRYPAGVRFLESLFQFAPSFLRKRWITPVRLSKRRQEEIQRQYVQVNLKLRHEFSSK